MRIAAVIVAAGRGKRFGSKKQFVLLQIDGKKQVLEITLSIFLKIQQIKEIVVVLPKEDLKRKFNFSTRVKIIAGGATRQHSVYNGLSALSADTDIVVIHDGVRPFISDKIIKDSISTARKSSACVAVVPVKDTVKIVKNGYVISTPERKNIFLAQTPQTFKYSLIMKAYKKAFEAKYFSTDDSALVEKLGKKVKVITGDYKNIKITTKQDIARK
ncbi:MAG: 2-C-methyl-D-erythritol 4-phosphate cytidylyltransferase [Elusimicrobia bacterium]|nr:2-C-methyl-D-erythritol 4-phosphate cytidylyltransferase [Elusimicrobiota bacterium]